MTFDEIIKFSPENQKVFDELKAKCIKGEIVPYVGAGMSAFASYIPTFKEKSLFPTWGNLICNKYKECFGEKKPDTMDYIEAADKIENKLGKNDFYEYIRQVMGGDLNDIDWDIILDNAESQAVSFIPKLFSSPIITTNFDQIIEKIYQKQKNKIPVAFPYNTQELEKVIDNRKQLIYKIHGCVSDAQNIVLAKSKYDEVYSLDSELVNSLSKICPSFHFLFLGCSIILNQEEGTKDYSTDLLEKIQQKSGMPHYAICNCDESQLETRRQELQAININAILYKSGEYDSVKIILQELLNEIKKRQFQIPEYVSEFIERKESVIQKIENKLNNNEQWTALTLTGFGGVGKTRAMSEYASKKQTENEYKHIIWFNALSADNVREEIRKFDIKEKLIVETEKDTDLIIRVFKNWLKENDNWLFLLDNVEHYEDIKVFFDFEKTLVGKRHILITSRKDEQEFSEIPNIPISTFELEESQEFLETRTKKTPDEYADKIHELLGGLPLALEQAAAYITNNKNGTYQSYFNLLEKNGTLNTLGKGDPENYYSASVGATYNISIQRIKNKSAKQLLNLCAFFAPDNIHSEWFVKANDVLPDELQNDVKDDTKFVEIKKDLQAYSLVRIDNSERISLHRLLQEVIQKTLEEEQEKWVDNCVKIMEKLKITDFDTVEARNDFREMSLHIETLFEHCKKATIEVSNLYHFFMFGFDKIKRHSYALKYKDKTLELRNQVFGKYAKETASTCNLVGVTYYNYGQYDEAYSYLIESLGIRKELFNMSKTEEDEMNIARSYNNIAILYYYQGNYREALNYYEQALKIKEKYKDYKDTAFTYNNIGALYDLMSQDDNNKAMLFHHKALDIREREYSIENVNTAFTYNNIGVIYKNQGNYHDALIFLEKALKIREDLYKNEAYHSEIAQTCTNLADIYINKENYSKALDLLQRAIEIYEKELPNTIDISKAYYNMAKFFYNQDDYKNALNWFVKVFVIRKKVLRDEHSSTQEVKNIMKNAYLKIKTNNPIPFEEWLNEQMK